MMKNSYPKSIADVDIKNKRVIVRVDFDVAINPDHSIADDERIIQNIPTLKKLLLKKNKLILIAKLGRPKGRDPKLSLRVLVDKLPRYLPGYSFTLIEDFLTEDPKTFSKQKDTEILLLENIRFYPQEKTMEPDYVKALCDLGDVYVNDAFGMAHRAEATTVGIPKYLPGFSGLALKKEVEVISQSIESPKLPLVTIIGGAKISSKIHLLEKLIVKSDYILLGGALANTFLKAQGYEIGDSLYEYEAIEVARKLLFLADQHPVQLMLPVDAAIANPDNKDESYDIVPLPLMKRGYAIYDIGPRTADMYSEIIQQAGTVVWNGPMGLFENSEFKTGTTAIYQALTHNEKAFTLVGGGDTLAALSHKKHLDRIDHVSTGGGAMLELIEKGTLPAVEALRASQKKFRI